MDWRDITNNTWKSIYRSISYRAKEAGLTNDHDDAAQDIILSWISGAKKHQPIKYAIIDFMRKLHGRIPRQYKEHTRKNEQTYEPIHQINNKLDADTIIKLGGLSHREEIILHLYLNGMQQYEIAKALNLTQARISTIFKKIIKIKTKKLSNEKYK